MFVRRKTIGLYGSPSNLGARYALAHAMIDKSWDASVGRRDFVCSVARMLALAALPDVESESLRIAILDGSPNASFRRGVELGISEARRAASLFRRNALEITRASSAQILIGMSEYEPRGEVVYLNCGARSDAYRSRCHPFVFHIQASDGTYARAANAAGGRIQLWSSRLERYGAAQLNDRYFAETHSRMDGDAWCGWFAIKLAWESSLQMKGEGPIGLRDHLVKSSTQFDGHKGAPLSFRPTDHQLRQPLYSVVDDKPPQDVPDIARSSGTMRDVLDSIVPPSRCGT